MTLPSGNRIFDRAAILGLHAYFPTARAVELERSQITTTESARMSAVDFPVTALLSVVGTFPDGSTAEITTIGAEGFVEIDSALRHDVALRTSICLVAGTAIRVPIHEFQQAIGQHTAFSDLVYHAIRVRSFITEQLALCAIRHTAEQRFARWLLLATYKLDTPYIRLTQDAISGLLGTRRATITTAAKAIQSSGAITYARGRIEIIDRDALLHWSCPCFEQCKNAIDILL